jgi:hypothetical protein
MKVKTDGAPTFTMAQLDGMSFDNQIPTTRGNRGKAQDKLDLATAAFATGGTSDIDFSNYISGIKNALSNANLGDELYTSMILTAQRMKYTAHMIPSPFIFSFRN